MFKITGRILALAALGLAVAAPGRAASTDDHAAAMNWSRAYVLTPLEHKRLRTYGLKDEEVFLIANAASSSWYDVDFLVQVYLCHYYTELQAIQYLNQTPASLKNRHPEWNTPEWQAAVNRGDPTWIPPQSPGGKEASIKKP